MAQREAQWVAKKNLDILGTMNKIGKRKKEEKGAMRQMNTRKRKGEAKGTRTEQWTKEEEACD